MRLKLRRACIPSDRVSLCRCMCIYLSGLLLRSLRACSLGVVLVKVARKVYTHTAAETDTAGGNARFLYFCAGYCGCFILHRRCTRFRLHTVHQLRRRCWGSGCSGWRPGNPGIRSRSRLWRCIRRDLFRHCCQR